MLSYKEILNQIIGVLDVEFDCCYDINKMEFKEDEIFVNINLNFYLIFNFLYNI